MEHTHLSLCVEPCVSTEEPVYTQITEMADAEIIR